MTKEEKLKDPNRVPFGKLIVWQTRPISAGAVAIILGYLMFYCTDVLKMDPALVGGLMMASKIFDGVTDLLAGWLVDNTKTRFGKGRPYELCIIGVWVCTYALFAIPTAWSITGKAVWVFIMYTLIYSIFQTLLNAAETPYVIRAFGTPVAVTKVSAFGGIIITLACMVVSVSFPIFVDRVGTDAVGWRKLILMYGIPLLAMGLLRFLFVKEGKTDVSEEKENSEGSVSLKDILTLLTRNKYVWICAFALMIPKMLGAMNIGTYYFNVIVGDLSAYSILQMCSVVILVFMVVFPFLMRKYSAMEIVGFAAALGVLGYILNYFAGVSMPMLIFGSIFAGISALPASYLKSPIIMQISAYNTIKGMKRMEASISAVINFLEKIGSAFGSMTIGNLLSMAHYDYEGVLPAQPESAVTMIRLCYSLIPAACTVLVILCVFAFRPLDKAVKENKTE